MKEQLVSVVGNSMYPAILPNDKVPIVKEDNYDVGDILVYIYRSEEFLTACFV